MTDQNEEVQPEPTLERRTRRRFSSAEKQRLLEEHDALPKGEKTAWLRQQGLYASQLANWRKTLTEQGTQGLEPSSGGRKPKDPRDRRIEELEKENARLENRAKVAEELVEVQKNVWTATVMQAPPPDRRGQGYDNVFGLLKEPPGLPGARAAQGHDGDPRTPEPNSSMSSPGTFFLPASRRADPPVPAIRSSACAHSVGSSVIGPSRRQRESSFPAYPVMASARNSLRW